jgi:hypothetical protein
VSSDIDDAEIKRIYGMTLQSLHALFIKRLRRHNKTAFAVMDANQKFVCGFIWIRNPNDGTVSAQCFDERFSGTPLIIEYKDIDNAWNEYKALIMSNL